ncbi:hypothetical protein [Microtetraspora niveoalba]|uniref:hypothetical protein n=1 Tax=Microtetraspora niveoalba TaxID=46175 RepID=UPI00082A25C5|nr:hypothetical protein [Microtetraspora niveoalba]
MARTPDERSRAEMPAAGPCVPAIVSEDGERSRMARFVAGSRLVRFLIVCGFIGAAWVLGVIFGAFGAAPASADTASSAVVIGSVVEGGASMKADGFPTSDDALVNAEAMAGRNVDGLTSQSKPGFPSPSTADHTSGSQGMVPQGSGGSILFGDVARSFHDVRLMALPAPHAAVLPPVVRTAADDPSISPD